MVVEILKNMQQIDRKTAARLLKVSIRTVDRYVASKKLSSVTKEGRIWLNKKEVQGLKKKKQVDKVDAQVRTEKRKMSIDKSVSSPVDMSIDTVDIVSTYSKEKAGSTKQESSGTIFKKLYEELKEELKTSQNRLEGANYRVGQLEAMVKESVPLLEHQKLLGESTAARLELEEESESLRDKLQKVAKKLKEERLSKRVYFTILFIIMLLQPLWLYFLSR